MGWQLANQAAFGYAEGPPLWITRDVDTPTFHNFHPSVEIAHAWLILAHDSTFNGLHLRQLSDLRTWEATFLGSPGVRGCGNTAPHAICIAALRAVGAIR